MESEFQQQINSSLAKARTALLESGLLTDGGYPLGAVSRAYTACYHSAMAVLISRDVDIIKPSAMLSCFDKQLVRRGYIEECYHAMFAQAHRHKQIADVDGEETITVAEAAETLAAAKAFVRRMEKFLFDAGLAPLGAREPKAQSGRPITS